MIKILLLFKKFTCRKKFIFKMPNTFFRSDKVYHISYR